MSELNLDVTDDEDLNGVMVTIINHIYQHPNCSLSLPEYTGDCGALGHFIRPALRRDAHQNQSSCALVCDSVTTVADLALAELDVLKTVSMASVKHLGWGAFFRCPELTTVVMPKVETVARDAFCHCKALLSASMPAAVIVGAFAFDRCTALTTVSMASVETVERDACRNCTALTTVSMANVKTLGRRTFRACTALTTVSMASVETVGRDAFRDCTSISRVTCPPAALAAVIADADGPVLVTTDEMAPIDGWTAREATQNDWFLMTNTKDQRDKVRGLHYALARFQNDTGVDLPNEIKDAAFHDLVDSVKFSTISNPEVAYVYRRTPNAV